MKNLIDKLHQKNFLSAEEFHRLLANRSQEDEEYARNLANQVRQQVYGNKIYVRGLIEFTNYCKNDCFYCGIRRSNREAQRYRLTEEDILTCCAEGYELGFRTFVLQGGEDPFFTDEKIVHMIHEIKKKYPDCALTLSIGEKSEESYRAFREAGADRYLLRHETADTRHYSRLHPYEMSCEHRKNCLRTLKKLGFQTGAGFMVGSPLQTIDNGPYCGGPGIHARPSAGDGGNRAVYPAQRYSVCRGARRNAGGYIVLSGASASDASTCIAAGDNGAWNNSSRRT